MNTEKRCYICGNEAKVFVNLNLSNYDKKKIVEKSKHYPGLFCENCYNNMKKGIYFICVKNIIANKRIKTGKTVLINENKVLNMIKNKKTLELILKRRFCLIEESIFNKIINK